MIPFGEYKMVRQVIREEIWEQLKNTKIFLVVIDWIMIVMLWKPFYRCYIGTHQYARGSQHSEDRTIGLSRGGLTTKTYMCTDANENPVYYEINRGQVVDYKVAGTIIENIREARHFIADKGYDSDLIREQARPAEMKPVITRKSNSKRLKLEFDS